MGRICKKGFKSGMKERMGDEKLIIISVAVRGINDRIRFYSQMLCTAAINTSNTTRTQGSRRRYGIYRYKAHNAGNICSVSHKVYCITMSN